MAQLDEFRRIIAETEDKYGIDRDDLFKIASIESNINPKAVGPMTRYGTAKGAFQFIDDTAKRYGLDDPHDFSKAADAAARYWKDMEKRYGGDKRLMVAEYNGGMGSAKRLREGRDLNPETSNYLELFFTGKGKGRTMSWSGVAPQAINTAIPASPSTASEVTPAGKPEGADGVQQDNPSVAPDILSARPAQLTPVVDPIKLQEQEMARDKQYGGITGQLRAVPEALRLGIENENSVFNFMADQYIAPVAPDVDFRVTDEDAKIVTDGIPSKYHSYIIEGALSRDHLYARRARMVEAMANQRELGQMGGVGMVASMAAAVVDLPLILAAVPGAGEVALVSRASRVRNALATGLGWSATNAATEAALYSSRPLAEADDIYIAAAAGLAFGGVFGARLPKFDGLGDPMGLGRRLMNRIVLNDMEREGLNLTNKGRRYFNDNGLSIEEREILQGSGDQLDLFDTSPTRGSTSVTDEGTSTQGSTRSYDSRQGSLFGDDGQPILSKERLVDYFNNLDERIKGREAAKEEITYGYDYQLAAEGPLGVLATLVHRSLRMAEQAGRKDFGNVVDLLESVFRYNNINGGIEGVNDQVIASLERTFGLGAGTFKDLSQANLFAMGVRTSKDVRTVAEAYLSRNKTKPATNGMTAVWALRGEATAKEFLTDFVNGKLNPEAMTKAHPSLKALAKVMLKALKQDMDIIVLRGNAKGRSDNPYYDFVRHRVVVSSDYFGGWSDRSISTMLHEISHGLTVHKLHYGLKNPDSAIGKVVKELESLRKIAQDAYIAKYGDLADAPKSPSQHYTRYYVTGNPKYDLQKIYREGGNAEDAERYAIREFVAGMYSGEKAFFELLDSIPYKGGQSLASKLWEVIGKLLGFEAKDGTVLQRFVALNQDLLDEGLTVQQRASRNDPFDSLAFSIEPPRFEAGRGVDGVDAEAAQSANVSTVFGWGLGLENRLLNGSTMQGARNLAAKLFGTTIGFKDHSVVNTNAWDDTLRLYTGWHEKVLRSGNENFLAWAKEKNVPMFQKGAAWDAFNLQVTRYIRGVDGEYDPQVIAHGNLIRSLKDGEVLDLINNPSGHHGGSKKGLTQNEVKDKETGETKLTDPLERNPNYFPRKHDVTKWQNVVARFGRAAVEDYFSKAFRNAHDDATDEAVEAFGKWYVKAYEEAHVNRTTDLFDDLVQGRDRDALRDSLMRNGGMGEYDADKIIDGMFKVEKGNLTSSLKRRNLLDESLTLEGPDGTKLSIEDFTNTNATEVFDSYLRRMSGAISVAHNLDVYRMGDFSKQIASATRVQLGDKVKPQDLRRMRDDLQFAFDRIMGVPIEDQSKFRKTLEMFRSWNVIRLMGGAVFNQVTETGQMLGTLGFRAFTGAVPEYTRIARNIKAGRADEETKFFQNLFDGLGTSFTARMDFRASDDWQRLVGDDKRYARWLDNVDNVLRKGAKGVLDYSGMTPLMLMQRKVHATAFVNHLVDVAGGAKSILFTEDRLAWMGFKPSEFDALTAAIQKHKGKEMWTKLQEESPDLYAKMMTAVQRESRRVVQENDLGSMIPVMGKSVAQTLFQFQNFGFHAWNKATAFGWNHRDTGTMLSVLYSGMLASLAYSTRAYIGTAGMDEFERRKALEEKLTAKQIVANGFGKTSQASLLPQIIDTVSPVPFFTGLRTTSDVSSFASNPTVGLLDTALSSKKLIRNYLDDDLQTTSKDVKALGKLLPLNNTLFVAPFLNSLASDFPSSDKE